MRREARLAPPYAVDRCDRACDAHQRTSRREKSLVETSRPARACSLQLRPGSEGPPPPVIARASSRASLERPAHVPASPACAGLLVLRIQFRDTGFGGNARRARRAAGFGFAVAAESAGPPGSVFASVLRRIMLLRATAGWHHGCCRHYRPAKTAEGDRIQFGRQLTGRLVKSGLRCCRWSRPRAAGLQGIARPMSNRACRATRAWLFKGRRLAWRPPRVRCNCDFSGRRRTRPARPSLHHQLEASWFQSSGARLAGLSRIFGPSATVLPVAGRSLRRSRPCSTSTLEACHLRRGQRTQ